MGEGGLNAVWGGALKGSTRLRANSMIGILAPFRFRSLRVARFANIRAALRFVRTWRVLRLTTTGSGARRVTFRVGTGVGAGAVGTTVSTTTVLEFASSSTKGIVVSAAARGGGPAAGFGDARAGGATNRYVPSGGSCPRDSGLGEAGDADPRLATAEGRLGAGAGVARRTLLRVVFAEGGGAAEGFARATGGMNGRGEFERGSNIALRGM